MGEGVANGLGGFIELLNSHVLGQTFNDDVYENAFVWTATCTFNAAPPVDVKKVLILQCPN